MANGMQKWSAIADKIPGRIGKQCRERWANHLDPALKGGDWSDAEDGELVAAQAELGNAWTKISARLCGRSENAVKNRWNSAPVRRKVMELHGGQLPLGASAPPKKRSRKADTPAAAEGAEDGNEPSLPLNKKRRGKKAVGPEAPGENAEDAEAADEVLASYVVAPVAAAPVAAAPVAATPVAAAPVAAAPEPQPAVRDIRDAVQI
jgi:hypothetical protein